MRGLGSLNDSVQCSGGGELVAVLGEPDRELRAAFGPVAHGDDAARLPDQGLARSCEPGSIRVPELFSLESYPNVHHLVSSITGRLRSDCDAIDLLMHAFPGGSITGAPKIRAMQIIEELEPVRRSLYCGSVGYLGCEGQMDFNIAIRSLVCHASHIYCWGGGGIVADSELDAEYQETLTKVGNLLDALHQAQ